jgi:hypothetical protein
MWDLPDGKPYGVFGTGGWVIRTGGLGGTACGSIMYAMYAHAFQCWGVAYMGYMVDCGEEVYSRPIILFWSSVNDNCG